MRLIINKDISIKGFIAITILAMILGLLTLYISTKGFIEVNILNISKVTTSIITDYSYEYVSSSTKDMDHNNETIIIKYDYEVNGIHYQNKSNMWWKLFSIGLKKGDNLKIYYRVNNPKLSEIYHISYVLLFVSILFIILPPVSLIKRIKNI